MRSKKFLVIGTAGHIDHGKTSLIKALTGVDTDRWEEEKKRGMTIDLGFAHLELPNGISAGIVDVPGHEKFIKNMLAGAHGIDLVLFVIAADEGIMPQTEEHLTVCQMLGTKKGIVVITKTDLVDEEWLELVREEAKEFVKGSFLEGAPIVEVSSKTGKGIRELIEQIEKIASEVEQRSSEGIPILPVDRSFTVKGFGTVITGTLISGKVKVGDTLEILPKGIKTKVRGIQVHGKEVKEAFAGQRTALNLSDVSKEEVSRGDVIAAPGYLKPTKMVDVVLQLSKNAQVLIQPGFKVHFHYLTQETEGEVHPIDREEVAPGEKAVVQVRLKDYVVPVYGGKFVIRNYSPARVIGGGWIVNPLPSRKFRRRFKEKELNFLIPLTKGESEKAKILHLVKHLPGEIGVRDLVQRLNLPPEKARKIVEELKTSGEISEFSGKLYPREFKERIKGRALEELEKYHELYPVAEGINKESLKSLLNVPSSLFETAVEELLKEGRIEEKDSALKIKGFRPEPKGEFSQIVETLKDASKKGKFSPPSLKELSRSLKIPENKIYLTADFLVKNYGYHKIGDFLFSPEAFGEIFEILKKHFARKETLSVPEFKDYLKVSRKFAIPILEYLDSLNVTERKGNERVRGKAL
jgi:selenocysteine-specific elongation factor